MIKLNKRKKWLIIIIPILIIVSLLIGFLINKEQFKQESNLKEEYAKELEKKYNNLIKTTFTAKTNVKKNCHCLGNFGIDNSCFIEICDKIHGEYIWKYKVCANNPSLCILAEYHDELSSWVFPGGNNALNTILFISEATDIFKKYNISYQIYNDNQWSNDNRSFFILINMQDNQNIIKAIKEINQSKYINLLCPNNNTLCNSNNFIILNHEDYNKTIEKIKKTKLEINGKYTLYELITDSNNYLEYNKFIIENHNITTDDNILTCNKEECQNYNYIIYEYIIGTNTSYDGTIDVIGIKKK